jgi:hypothetical protein
VSDIKSSNKIPDFEKEKDFLQVIQLMVESVF